MALRHRHDTLAAFWRKSQAFWGTDNILSTAVSRYSHMLEGMNRSPFALCCQSFLRMRCISLVLCALWHLSSELGASHACSHLCRTRSCAYWGTSAWSLSSYRMAALLLLPPLLSSPPRPPQRSRARPPWCCISFRKPVCMPSRSLCRCLCYSWPSNRPILRSCYLLH